MSNYYDTIYLSPHLDDAVLSCGGRIFAQTQAGQSVLIVTITAGDPVTTNQSEFSASLHDRWQLVTNVVDGRRQEDIAACRVLGADYAHWDVADCIYRLHPDSGELLYTSRDAIFGDVADVEMALVTDLAERMTKLPAHGQMIAPLTIGHHVDHQLTRLAAERAFSMALAYYEDYPYAHFAEGLTAVIDPADPQWQADTIPLDDTLLQKKADAISCYESQLSTFFNGRSDLDAQLAEYANRIGGERLWRKE